MLKFETKDKLINRIMKNGKKNKSEKIFLNSVKLLQKSYLKGIRNVLIILLINTLPIFKLNILRTKRKKNKIKIKEIPVFLSLNKTRISLAIRMIINTTKEDSKNNIFYYKLAAALINNSKEDGVIITTKNNLQQRVVDNKKYLRNYRW